MNITINGSKITRTYVVNFVDALSGSFQTLETRTFDTPTDAQAFVDANRAIDELQVDLNNPSDGPKWTRVRESSWVYFEQSISDKVIS